MRIRGLLPQHLSGGHQVQRAALQPISEADHLRMEPGGQHHDEGRYPHAKINTDRPGPRPKAHQTERMNQSQISATALKEQVSELITLHTI